MDGSIKIRTLKKGLNKDKKVYDVFYRYIDPQTGQKKQTSKKGFKKKKEAEEYLISVQNDIKNNKYIPNRSLTVKKYMTDWYAKAVEVDPDLKQTTKDGYKVNIYNHVIPELGDKLLSELNKIRYTILLLEALFGKETGD